MHWNGHFVIQKINWTRERHSSIVLVVGFIQLFIRCLLLAANL